MKILRIKFETERRYDYFFGRFYNEHQIVVTVLLPGDILVANTDLNFWRHLVWVLAAYGLEKKIRRHYLQSPDDIPF